MKPPIIIIGMHRSGTSMISRFLESTGLFLGKKKESNNEAIFFQRINDWILQQTGGGWNQPQTIQYLIEDDALRHMMTKYIEKILGSFHFLNYLGLKKYMQYHWRRKIDFAWGWKDPRNTFTLPLWLELFPGAKVVHIFRHGIDVARSLILRRQRSIEALEKYVERPNAVFWLNPLRPNLLRSVRAGSIEQGFGLWKKYMNKAHEFETLLGDDMFSIKYEDFLGNPVTIMQQLCAFCELQPTRQTIQTISLEVDKKRAYSYRKYHDLLDFEKSVSADLCCFGYEQIF